MTNAKMLQSRQTVARSRLVDERSIPTIDKTNGIAELVSRIPNRNLSIFDHSCTERFRNATTTPANPASVTATWALALKASLGCIYTKSGLTHSRTSLELTYRPSHIEARPLRTCGWEALARKKLKSRVRIW